MPLTGPTIFHTSSAGDGRLTWGELKRSLARPVNDNDEGVLATAQDCLTSAVRTLNRFVWPHERVTHSVSIVSGTDTYALPSAFKREMAGYLLDSSRPNIRLLYIGVEEFYGNYNLKQDGQPTIYVLENTHETGQVTFWPRPNSSYSAKLWYYRRSGSKYKDAEIPDWDEEFEEAALQWAWAEMCKRLPGSEYKAQLGDARREAYRARAELIQAATSRGDSMGLP